MERPSMEEEARSDVGEGGEMKPWEQHSSVISIPRFDYKAPSSLLDRPLSGFLVTCPIKREKSATKEAISILEKFLKVNRETCELSDLDHDAKRRKMYSEEKDLEHQSKTEGQAANGVTSKESRERKHGLSLVKLKKNGLLLFTFLDDCKHCAVNVLSSILSALDSGDLKRPEWCFRIFPIQKTCIMEEKEVCQVVLDLVKVFINNSGNKLGTPIRFAICYDRRGVDETNIKTTKPSVVDGNGNLDLLVKDTCFKVVAKAVKDVAMDAVIDLKSPELVVRIELLPVSGLPDKSFVAGISVLSKDLLSIKSRGICMKSLIADCKVN